MTPQDQLTADLVQHRAAHHPPQTPDVIEAHSEIRNRVNELAQYLADLLPDVPEKADALRALDMAMMWANSAVARTQLQETGYYPGT